VALVPVLESGPGLPSDGDAVGKKSLKLGSQLRRLLAQVAVEVGLTPSLVPGAKACGGGPVEPDTVKTTGGEYVRDVLPSHVLFDRWRDRGIDLEDDFVEDRLLTRAINHIISGIPSHIHPIARGGVKMAARFRDRHHAGRRLAEALASYAARPNLLVLALPRGGVPVGYEVARALHAPLDVMLVRKLGVPGHEELAMGAIASGGVRVLTQGIINRLRIPDRVIATVVADEERELVRRERAYRNDRPPPDVRGKTVILVDDGLATGSTMRAAAAALRLQDPERLVIAVPVAPRETCESLLTDADDVVCATVPEPFFAVGNWYEDFSQSTDTEVRELLRRAAEASD
jgi:putative phosphoribosyl transferase